MKSSPSMYTAPLTSYRKMIYQNNIKFKRGCTKRYPSFLEQIDSNVFGKIEKLPEWEIKEQLCNNQAKWKMFRPSRADQLQGFIWINIWNGVVCASECGKRVIQQSNEMRDIQAMSRACVVCNRGDLIQYFKRCCIVYCLYSYTGQSSTSWTSIIVQQSCIKAT